MVLNICGEFALVCGFDLKHFVSELSFLVIFEVDESDTDEEDGAEDDTDDDADLS